MRFARRLRRDGPRGTAAALVAVLVVGAGCRSGPADAGSPGSAVSATTTIDTMPAAPSRGSATPRPTGSARTRSASQIKAAVDAAVRALSGGSGPGGVSVAALDTVTGARYDAGADSGMWTASAYKLFLLVALMLRHQSSGTGLSDYERDLAAQAIENSDNVAGYSLFQQVGGRAAMAAAAQQLGMSNTVPGRSDPTFTTTSAADYLRVLACLTGSGCGLGAPDRDYALGLMRDVEPDQRWGVGTAADPGTAFANKNGWLSVDDSNGPGENDSGLWAVSSVGVLTVGGHRVLMAVFTQHQRSFTSGVQLVEALAKAMRPLITG